MVLAPDYPYIGNREGRLAAIALLASYGVRVDAKAGIYYVDNSHTNSGTGKHGLDPNNPLSTIDEAIGNCTASRGDIIVVGAGHAETVTAAITLDVAGVTIIGMGHGTNRPQITGNFAGDVVTVTAANCRISGLYFNESTAVATAQVNIAAIHCQVDHCHFDVGDANGLETITIAAAGDDAVIEHNTFNVTGNGPDAAIEIEAAGVARTTIRYNTFIGSDGTNAWDAAAINSTVANTGLIVHGNVFSGVGVVATSVIAASAVDKAIFDNAYVADAVDADDPAGRAELDGIATKHALLNGGRVWYVSSTGGDASFDGLAPTKALATINAAIDAASAGDTIIVLEGHVETISNATTIIPDVAGLEIIGMGRGARRPTITLDNAASNIPISGAGTVFKNFLILTTGTVDVTAGITVTGADVLVEDVEIRHAAADSEIVDSIVITTGGDRCRVVRPIIIGFAGGDAAAAGISIPAAIDRVVIEDAYIDGLFSAGCIENVTAAATLLRIVNPVLRQRHATQDAGIAVVATATGAILSPRIRTATNDANGFNEAITSTNDMEIFDPLVVNADGEIGGVWGTASAAA